MKCRISYRTETGELFAGIAVAIAKGIATAAGRKARIRYDREGHRPHIVVYVTIDEDNAGVV